MVVNTLNFYPFGMAFSHHAQQKYGPQALPAPDSAFSLAHLASKPLDEDTYLKRLVEELQSFYSKEKLAAFRPTLTVKIDREEFELLKHLMEFLFTLFGPPQELPPSPRHYQPKNVLDAVFSLFFAVIDNRSMEECIKDLLRQDLEGRPKNKLSESVLKKIKSLKEKLLKYTTALDDVLQLYTCTYNCESCHMTGEMLERIKSAKNDIKYAMKKIRPEEMGKLLPEGRSISPDHILCSVLGIQEDCAVWLNNMPEAVRCHQPDSYWIERYLEGKAEAREDYSDEGDGATSRPSSMREEFAALGFTEHRASYLADWLAREAGEYWQHHTMLDWAKRYINDLFQYDILLTEVPRYPYNPGETKKWFNMEIEAEDRLWDKDDDESDGELEEGAEQESPPKVPVPIINLTGTKDLSYTSRDGVQFPPESDDKHLVLFHGTDHKSAVSLVEEGIRFIKGKNNQDFSGHSRKGFYLSPDFEWTKTWAHSRSCSHSAVVMYKVPKEHLVQFDKSCIDLYEDKAGWEEIVRHCRTDGKVKLPKETAKEYKKASHITGPICITKPIDCKPSFRPQGFDRGTKQTCIVSEKMAQIIGDIRYIHGVLFF